MSDETDLYPAGPENPPIELTKPSTAYRLQVVVMLLSLFLFLAIYLGLVYGMASLVWWGVTTDFVEGRGGWFVKLGFISICVALFFFLLKNLFKRHRFDEGEMLELTEEDEPHFFAFLRRLCEETAAPFPQHVYVTGEVNAAVIYKHSLLSLVFPPKKNLLIGLGLVSALNLTELKAVLAHEFGHFSQKSLRIGGYVYVVNRIMADMIWARDRWDDALEAWCRTDLRIAVFGWVVKGVVWLLRWLLGLLFRGINLLDAALSRQREFDADRIAVSVAGSDAICHALLKISFADLCLQQALSDLTNANAHGLLSNDIILHQERSAEYLRSFRKRPRWGIPPELPDEGRGPTVFDSEDEDVQPTMWSTHPSNRDREKSAKELYLRSEMDERPAWVLFRDAGELRQRITAHVTGLAHGPDRDLTDAEEVQRFIDEDREESTFDVRYHDMYEGRPIEPGDVATAFRAARNGRYSRSELEGMYEELYEGELPDRMERYKELSEELLFLERVRVGEIGNRKFAFRGEKHHRNKSVDLIFAVDGEIRKLRKWLAKVDVRVIAVHAGMAEELDDESSEDLEDRYEFQLTVQRLTKEMDKIRASLQLPMELIVLGKQLSPGEFDMIVGAFTEAHEELSRALEEAGQVSFPPLKHLEEESDLGSFLLASPLIDDSPLRSQLIDGLWLEGFLVQLGEVQDKLRRIHYKSMGGLLAFQEKIAERWEASAASS